MTVQIERTLQSEIILRMRAGGWPMIALPVPNGLWMAARDKKDRDLVARFMARMKADGMLVPGAPDLVILWRGGGGMIELKRPKTRTPLGTIPAGRPSVEQQRMAERAAMLGVHYAISTGWDDTRDRLREWGAPL